MDGAGELGASADRTRSVVLDLIRWRGRVSRPELADMTGLTAASISRVTRSLLESGLVVEGGQAESTGGKRRSLIELAPLSRLAVGVSLGASEIRYVVTDLSGEVVTRIAADGTADTPPGEVVPRVAARVRDLIEQHGLPIASIVGIGVAGAGLDLTRRATGTDVAVDEWDAYPVEHELRSGTGLPVVRDNDATCAALGRFWSSRSPGSQDFASLYLAVGFGMGIVVGGRPLRGASSNVGEIGHVVLQVDGPDCWCGSRGCLEVLAGPRAVIAHVSSDSALATDLGLRGGEAHVLDDFDAICAAAAAGDPIARAAVERSAGWVAVAILSVVNLLDLERLHLAGPGFRIGGEFYRRAIADLVGRAARTRGLHGLDIELADPGADDAAVGAATLALQAALTPHVRSAHPTGRIVASGSPSPTGGNPA